MTDERIHQVPVFMVSVPQQDLQAMKDLLQYAQEAVSVIEKETGSLLTRGNRDQDTAMVSFGHDIFALLFSFPSNYRSLFAFFNEAAKQDSYSVRSGDIGRINSFFAGLEYDTRVPVDKTIRGKFYPARWESRSNIPCLLHQVRDTATNLAVYAGQLEKVEGATKTLNQHCRVARGIWEPYFVEVAAQTKNWRLNTPEGQAYDASMKERIASIIAGAKA